jgi:hypothetical protein
MDKDEVVSLVQRLLEGHQERAFQEMESIHDQLEVIACLPFPRSDWSFKAVFHLSLLPATLILGWHCGGCALTVCGIFQEFKQSMIEVVELSSREIGEVENRVRDPRVDNNTCNLRAATHHTGNSHAGSSEKCSTIYNLRTSMLIPRFSYCRLPASKVRSLQRQRAVARTL